MQIFLSSKSADSKRMPRREATPENTPGGQPRATRLTGRSASDVTHHDAMRRWADSLSLRRQRGERGNLPLVHLGWRRGNRTAPLATATARAVLNGIVEKFPKTKAAAEAKALLEKLDK